MLSCSSPVLTVMSDVSNDAAGVVHNRSAPLLSIIAESDDHNILMQQIHDSRGYEPVHGDAL